MSSEQQGRKSADHEHSHSRRPHAVLDIASKRWKASKIERLLDLSSRHQPIRILEVGTGSGGIAHYYGTHPGLRCEVNAADVHDNRLATEGFRYTQVSDTRLPFAESTFDVVLTNHVIEHVGDEVAQHYHLSEIHRVLRTDGIGYIAVPNRWMLVEPHFRLAFLSWMPRSWRTSYVPLMRKGPRYDCEPLQLRQLEKFMAQASFGYENISISAMRTTIEIERPRGFILNVLRNLPDLAWTPLRRVMPTLIYRFWAQ